MAAEQPFSTNWLQLCLAADRGDAAEVQAHLALPDASVNAVGTAGLTVLHVAAGRGLVACVQALLAAGANLDTADSSGYTALMLAASSGHAPCVQSLLATPAGTQ
jgi:ankyrin repeat protein